MSVKNAYSAAFHGVEAVYIHPLVFEIGASPRAFAECALLPCLLRGRGPSSARSVAMAVLLLELILTARLQSRYSRSNETSHEIIRTIARANNNPYRRHWRTIDQAINQPSASCRGRLDVFRRNSHNCSTPAARASLSPSEVVLTTVPTTVAVVLMGNLTPLKMLLFRHLQCHIPVPIVIGYDSAASDHEVRVINALAQSRSFAFSSKELQRKYGTHIGNFAGKRMWNQAKLASLDWFASSGFDRMWHLEDDAFVQDASELLRAYDAEAADLIAMTEAASPFWVKDGWRVGTPDHTSHGGTFHYVNTAVMRVSRSLALTTLRAIREEKTTSHHEVFLPYVFSLDARLTVAPLQPRHGRGISTNLGQLMTNMTLCAALRTGHAVAHPVKYFTS